MTSLPLSERQPARFRYLHLAIVYLVWGSTYLAVKIGISGPGLIVPLQFQTWRMALLGAISLAVSGWPTSIGVRDLARCAITGILMWAMGMIPVWTTLVSGIVYRTLPSRVTLLGLLFGILGLGLIFGPPVLYGDAHVVARGYGPWIAMTLSAAGLTLSIGTILQRPVLRNIEPSWAASLQMLAAALVLAGMCKLNGHALMPEFHFSTSQIGAFTYAVVFGSAICLISYLKVLETFSPSVASTFAYINPIVGIILGWTVLGEVPARSAIIGMGLVLIGGFLVMMQTGSARR